MTWQEQPSFDDVKSALRQRASLTAQIRVLEYELQELQAKISLEKPRNTAVKIVGYDEETRMALQGINHSIINLRCQLDDVEAEIKFGEYHKDMFKALAYRERI